MKARLLPYQLAMGKAAPAQTDGPLEGEALEQYLAEVDARTQLRAYDAMEKALRGTGAPNENTVTGYDPFTW